jgi:hypothetical protein
MLKAEQMLVKFIPPSLYLTYSNLPLPAHLFVPDTKDSNFSFGEKNAVCLFVMSANPFLSLNLIFLSLMHLFTLFSTHSFVHNWIRDIVYIILSLIIKSGKQISNCLGQFGLSWTEWNHLSWYSEFQGFRSLLASRLFWVDFYHFWSERHFLS